MKRGLWLIACFMLCGVAGCAHIGDYARIAQNQVLSEKYAATLEKWTRAETVYSNFETNARIVTTYRSPEFQEAYRAEYEKIYGPGGAGKNPIYGVKDAGGDFREFYVYAYTPQNEANDFARQGSIWNVVLRGGDGLPQGPLEIREIEEINPFVMTFFPYVNRYYGKFYSLRFAAAKKDSRPHLPSHQVGDITLTFSSVLGDVTLEW